MCSYLQFTFIANYSSSVNNIPVNSETTIADFINLKICQLIFSKVFMCVEWCACVCQLRQLGRNIGPSRHSWVTSPISWDILSQFLGGAHRTMCDFINLKICQLSFLEVLIEVEWVCLRMWSMSTETTRQQHILQLIYSPILFSALVWH